MNSEPLKLLFVKFPTRGHNVKANGCSAMAVRPLTLCGWLMLCILERKLSLLPGDSCPCLFNIHFNITHTPLFMFRVWLTLKSTNNFIKMDFHICLLKQAFKNVHTTSQQAKRSELWKNFEIWIWNNTWKCLWEHSKSSLTVSHFRDIKTDSRFTSLCCAMNLIYMQILELWENVTFFHIPNKIYHLQNLNICSLNLKSHIFGGNQSIFYYFLKMCVDLS